VYRRLDVLTAVLMNIKIFCYVTQCRFLNISGILLGIPLRLSEKVPPAGHSPQRPGFNPGPVRVRFLVDSVALERVCHQVQGGSNMTGTDLCVNKPHCAAAVRP